jgi:hypothetical protein
LGNDKKYFEATFEVYAGTADLYSYFIERGIKLLAPGGIFSYIVANKWMRASYGRALRNWLKTKCIDEITDFGDLRVFENATTYPCILRVTNREPHFRPWVTTVKTLDFGSLYEHVQEVGSFSEQNLFEEEGWSLSNVEIQRLMEKIKQNSIPLEEYVGGKIFRGILTGLNEAFVIDRAKRERLIFEDPRSTELIKPFAIGREIKRYMPIENKQYLIFIPRGWTNLHTKRTPWKWFSTEYPAIAKHLQQFEQKALARGDKGDYWWELRACSYYNEFEKPKITWGNLAQKPKFTMDLNKYYVNAPSVIIPLEDYYLLGILNSSLAYRFICAIAAERQGGFLEYKPMYVSQIPVHVVNTNDIKETEKVQIIISLVRRRLLLQNKIALTPSEKTLLEEEKDNIEWTIDDIVCELYDFSNGKIEK